MYKKNIYIKHITAYIVVFGASTPQTRNESESVHYSLPSHAPSCSLGRYSPSAFNSSTGNLGRKPLVSAWTYISAWKLHIKIYSSVDVGISLISFRHTTWTVTASAVQMRGRMLRFCLCLCVCLLACLTVCLLYAVFQDATRITTMKAVLPSWLLFKQLLLKLLYLSCHLRTVLP